MEDSTLIAKRENNVKFFKASTTTQQTPLLNTDSHVEIIIPTKTHGRRITGPINSGASNKATIIDENGYKTTTAITICQRRNTWPKLTTIPRKETFHVGKKRKHSGRVKKYFIKKKRKIVSKKNKVEHQVSPYLRILPFLLAVTGLLLPVADLGTDMASSYRICTAECHCEYIDYKCSISHDKCGDVMINGTSMKNSGYCENNNRAMCMSKEGWKGPKTHFGFEVRHPLWCRLSIEFIVVPSIFNNVITLISMLYKAKYKQYLITAGLSSIAKIHRSVAYLTLTLMAMLQILPYMCMCLKIITAWRVFRNKISEDGHSELDAITRNVGIIFSLTEDLPQLTLQTMFFVRAIVHYAEDGIVNDLSWVAVAGLVTSCLSLSKNYTLYVIHLRSTSTSPVYIFSTAFISAGGTVLVCVLMAVGHQHSGYTQKILSPVTNSIAIQIALHFFKLRFSNSGQSSINEIRNRFSHGQTNCSKFLTGARILGSGIRSIMFSAIMDGYSPLGLWSNACYATWALWHKVKFLTDSDTDTDFLSSIALRWSMILYVINSILVFKNYPGRKNSILVSLLFLVYPIYLCVLAKVHNKNTWYGPTYKDDIIFEIIKTVIPVIALVGLVMLVNVLSFILNKVKFRKPAIEDQVHSGIIRKWASMEF